jgi:hypothetical protein
MTQCVDPFLATALEGHFIGNHGTQPQPDTVEEGTVSAVHLLQFPHANSRWRLNIFFIHQQAVPQKPRSKSSLFIKDFFLIVL